MRRVNGLLGFAVLGLVLWLCGDQLRAQSNPSALPLINQNDIRYLGSFAVPGNDGSGADTGLITYGGNALGVSSDGKTLYIGCHDWYSRLAQVSIPAIGGTAQVVTRCTAIPRLDQVDPGSGSSYKLGGSLQWNGRTIIAGYSFYDGDANQRASHFVGSTNLTGITGPSAMTVASGFVSGYMGVIPQEWRSAFGGPAFTGFCCGAILSRTSNGPTATVFNPDDVGRANPIQATQVLAYPLDHAPGTDVFSNAGDNVVGVAFPAGTRSVLFIGLKATGRYCYGTGQECGDPSSNWKGPHGYPYYHEIWAYDANDLVAVKNGSKKPWEPRPYAHIRLTQMNNSGGAKIRGAAYDPISKRIYIAEDYGDNPRIHVYEVTGATGAPPTTTPPPSTPPPSTPPPSTPPNNSVSCQVSSWSDWQATTAWSACVNDRRTRSEQRTRSILTPPSNGGQACPALTETRTASQSCSVPTPTEACNDGVDNDGDGQVDENCTTAPTRKPGAPRRLWRTVQGSNVSFGWWAPISGGRVSSYVLEAGLSPGTTIYSVPVGTQTTLRVPNVGPGRYYVRVRGVNNAGAGAASNEVAVSVGCNSRPRGPRSFSARVNGSQVSLNWVDEDGCNDTRYRLSVGSQPGASDLASATSMTDNMFAAAPPGRYFARVFAESPWGRSDASNELEIVVGGADCRPPSFDVDLSVSALGQNVALNWKPSNDAVAAAADDASPISYVLEAGTHFGAADIGTFPMGRETSFTTAVPPGAYYVRVRPADACGFGKPSNEVLVRTQ